MGNIYELADCFQPLRVMQVLTQRTWGPVEFVEPTKDNSNLAVFGCTETYPSEVNNCENISSCDFFARLFCARVEATAGLKSAISLDDIQEVKRRESYFFAIRLNNLSVMSYLEKFEIAKSVTSFVVEPTLF